MIYKLELTEPQLEVISAALGNAPFKLVAPVVAELQRQISAQQAPPEGKPAGKVSALRGSDH